MTRLTSYHCSNLFYTTLTLNFPFRKFTNVAIISSKSPDLAGLNFVEIAVWWNIDGLMPLGWW